MPRIPLADVGDLTAFGRDRGSGTALPSVDLRRGDAYFHTGLNSLMVLADGSAWRQVYPATVADAAARNAISTNYGSLLYSGFAVIENASGIESWWNGSGWVADRIDPVDVPLASNWTAYGAGFRTLHTWVEGATGFLVGMVKPVAQVAATDSSVGTLPDAYRPPAGSTVPTGIAVSNGSVVGRIDVGLNGHVNLYTAGTIPAGANVVINAHWRIR